MLTKEQWSKLKSILVNFHIYLKNNLTLFIEAIFYLIRTEYPFRDIPEVLGKPNSIFKKLNLGLKYSMLPKVFKLLSGDADFEWVFIDTSYMREYQHSAVIKEQFISKSIDENSFKIHLAVDVI